MAWTKQTARKSSGGTAPRKQLIARDSSDEDVEVTEHTQFIRNSLQTIFKQDLAFAGSFSFHRAYPEAPNPCLNINGIGTVGLPLHMRDAEAMKNHASQAPFGKATETVVDKSVRDTWEIDGKEVQFDNRAWAPFLDQVIHSVCDTLGVNHDASQPRCDLYKLLLYETGSHFKVHVDTEKANGMFATIVIVLPSKFDGGAVHVSHGDSSRVLDCSPNSHTDTTVLAWYTDVEHEVNRVTSGYRLALSFNLVHTTRSLRPALPTPSSSANRLREVLTSWRDGDGGPSKIIYLLNHKYSQANLSGSALKGADAQLVSTLEAVARPLGFRLGLANLICTESGYSNVMSESESVTMDEVEETTIEIENLVDLHGELIQRNFEYDVETEVIPDQFARDIAEGGYDDEDDHGGYTGNEGATIDRFYHRTVMVIWPSWAHYNIAYGEEALSRACKDLESSKTSTPTSEEELLVQFILSRLDEDDDDIDYDEVLCSVPFVACRWRDLAMWTKAMDKCLPQVGISALFVEGSINTAVETFGFPAAEPWIDAALKTDVSDFAALNFLDRFESWVTDNLANEVAKPINEWIHARRTHRVNNLTQLGDGNSQLFVDLVLKYNSVDFFEKTVLPQVKLHYDPSSLPEFAESLHDKASITEASRTRMTQELLAVAVAKIDFYGYGGSREYRTPSEVAISFIETCLRCGCDDLLQDILNRLMQPEHEAYGLETILPVLAYIGDAARSRSADKAFPDVTSFVKWTVSSYLEVVAASPKEVSASDIISLCGALEAVGQGSLIESQLLPELETLRMPSHTMKALLEGFHDKGEAIGLNQGPMKVLVAQLVTKYAEIVDFRSATRSLVNDEKSRMQAGLEALTYCLEAGVPESCAEVLRRFFTKSGGLDAQFLQSNAVPLLKRLRPLLRKHKLSVTTDAIAAPLSTLVLNWVNEVMGPRPSDADLAPLRALDKWTCVCVYCPPVRCWLAESTDASRTFSNLGATNRRHIEKFLKTHASDIATWQTVNVRPQGLAVTKSQDVLRPMRWKENQAEGRKLLDAISTNAGELHTILGSEFTMVVTQLGINAVASIPGQVMASGSGRQPDATAGPSGSSSKTATATTKKKRPKETGGGSPSRPPPKRQK